MVSKTCSRVKGLTMPNFELNISITLWPPFLPFLPNMTKM